MDLCAHIEECLHPWDKFHLIMMYDLFNVLLNSVWLDIIEYFLCPYSPVILVCNFLFVWYLYLVLVLG